MPSHETTADEAALVRALSDPATYGDPGTPVEHVQSHISHVFLVGSEVYKLKKPVMFPFLDFGTAERRRYFCEEEVRLNRRLAPSVYVGVVPVTQDDDGRIRLGGRGRVVDHVVRMRRLPSDRLLPALLGAGLVTGEMMDALAERIARFHAAADGGPDVAAHAAPEALVAAWTANLADAAPFVGRLLAPEDHEILTDFGPRFVRTHETLLRARQRGGRIREGHGDLHGEHVCFLDRPAGELAAGIYVFDCIEFSRALRCTDVAAEVAFLVMDLERRGHEALGARFATAYAAAADDEDVARLLPFYTCARACVRGKVEGLTSEEAEVGPADREAAAGRARRFFALALRHAWRAAGPAVIACSGPSGCGKSTLATLLAEATGMTLLSSDVVRKRRAGLEPTASAPASWGSGLYTPEARRATYEAMCAEIDAELAAGRGVVADATWMRRADRDLLAGVARARRRPWTFVACHADDEVVRARLAARARGPSVSDARWDTYLEQQRAWEHFGPDEPRIAVDTGGDAAAARASALRALWRWIHDPGRPSVPERAGRWSDST